MHVTERAGDDAETLFGSQRIRSDQDAFAGALSIGDAHLLALPVRCLAGVVSVVTCPFILRRHERDLKRAGASPPELPNAPGKGEARVTPASVNLVESVGKNDRKLVLEDLDLPARPDSSLEPWAQRIARAVHPGDDDAQSDVIARLSLVSDDVMSFLAGPPPTSGHASASTPRPARSARARSGTKNTCRPRPCSGACSPWRIPTTTGARRATWRGPCPTTSCCSSAATPGSAAAWSAFSPKGRRHERPHARRRQGRVRTCRRPSRLRRRAGTEVDSAKYGALAHRLPGMLLENGLAQATGFLLAKNNPEHHALLDDLCVVLRAARDDRCRRRPRLPP